MDVSQQIVKYEVTDAVIAKMKHQYMGLIVKDPDDADGFTAAHNARMIVKGARVGTEKKRKELKADALAFGRSVDSEAKRITALLRPIEDHLIVQEKIVTDEKERQRQAEEDAERARLDAIEREKREEEEARIRAGREADQKRLAAERARLEEDRAAMQAERDRVAAEQEAERTRLAAIEATQKAEADKLEAERARIAAEEAERKRLAELDKAKIEAAAQAKADAERRAVEAKAAEEKERELAALREAEAERVAEQDRKRVEALRPDAEKLRAYGNAVIGIPFPMFGTPAGLKEAKPLLTRVREAAAACAAYNPAQEATEPCTPK